MRPRNIKHEFKPEGDHFFFTIFWDMPAYNLSNVTNYTLHYQREGYQTVSNEIRATESVSILRIFNLEDRIIRKFYFLKLVSFNDMSNLVFQEATITNNTLGHRLPFPQTLSKVVLRI